MKDTLYLVSTKQLILVGMVGVIGNRKKWNGRMRMFSYKIENDGLIIEGEIKPGEKINGICCAGFDWEATLVFPDHNPGYVSVWGFCNNPKNCKSSDDHPLFNGVSNILQEDIALYLLGVQSESD